QPHEEHDPEWDDGAAEQGRMFHSPGDDLTAINTILAEARGRKCLNQLGRSDHVEADILRLLFIYCVVAEQAPGRGRHFTGKLPKERIELPAERAFHAGQDVVERGELLNQDFVSGLGAMWIILE